MGYLSLREQRFSDAVEHLKRASALQPFRSSVWEYLPLAYYYGGRKDDARSAAQNARRMASNPEEVERTEATLELVEKARESIVRAVPSIGFGDRLILAASVKEISTPEGDATVLRGFTYCRKRADYFCWSRIRARCF
jgi:DNA-binding SARP family transcriptional activator